MSTAVVPRAAALAAFLALGATARGGETTADWVRWSRERAESLERDGRAEDAIEEWAAMAQIDPRNPEPIVRAAVLAVETPEFRGHELVPGTPMFRHAERFVRLGVARGAFVQPGLAYVVGRLRFAEGRWADSWRAFSDAKQLGFDPVRARHWHYRAAVNRAAAFIDAGRPQEAMDELTALRAAQPGHPDEPYLLVDLASAKFRMMEPEVAKTILDEVIARTPGNADAHYLRAYILLEQGQLEEAVTRFRETLTHATASYSDRVHRNGLLRLSEALLKLDRLDEAEKTIQQVLDLENDDPDALFTLGRVRHARRDLDGAVKLYRRVARLTPDSLTRLVALKQVLHQLGETEEADEVGRRITEIQKRLAEEQADPNAPPQTMGK